jgi:hypothetical protein
MSEHRIIDISEGSPIRWKFPSNRFYGLSLDFLDGIIATNHHLPLGDEPIGNSSPFREIPIIGSQMCGVISRCSTTDLKPHPQ